MPIVTIRALPQPDIDFAHASAEISGAIAEAAGKTRKEIWVVWSEVGAGHYFIEDASPDTQPAETHPPVVEISSTSGRPPEVIEAMLRAAASSISSALKIKESNVRVSYSEIPPKRLYSRSRFQ